MQGRKEEEERRRKRREKEMIKRDGQAAAIRDSQATARAGKRGMSKLDGQAAAHGSQATAGARKTSRYRCKTRAAGASLERTANRDKAVIAGTRRALSRRRMAQGRTARAVREVNPETTRQSLVNLARSY